jgi:UDP-N-acetylmuramoyl-L-alanyl-D-glutamate--2,6-diaminopimelate ligase
VIVDYAHTDDSLRKLYETFTSSRKIAVLGSTGGGRDAWKRPVLGKIADEYCDEIIVTNEDPYDEDPQKIIDEVSSGVTKHTPKKILDRREAIHEALGAARPGDVVLITGKGTDPYIMGKDGSKEVWDDATVAKEELEKMFSKK